MSSNPYVTRRKNAVDEVMPLVRIMVDEAMETLRQEIKQMHPPVGNAGESGEVVELLQRTMDKLVGAMESVAGHMRATSETTKKILHVQKRLREDFNDLFEDAAELKMATGTAPTKEHKMSDLEEIPTPVTPMLQHKDEAGAE